jgi:hypothetical protein
MKLDTKGINENETKGNGGRNNVHKGQLWKYQITFQ